MEVFVFAANAENYKIDFFNDADNGDNGDGFRQELGALLVHTGIIILRVMTLMMTMMIIVMTMIGIRLSHAGIIIMTTIMNVMIIVAAIMTMMMVLDESGAH